MDVCVCMNRINLGGMQTVGYMQRLLQLTYPDLQTHVTLSRAKEIFKHHSYLTTHYREGAGQVGHTLRELCSGLQGHTVTIQPSTCLVVSWNTCTCVCKCCDKW